MLNVGLIGNTEVLEPHVKLIQKNKNINVIGKASVGTSAQLNGFHFSIPEFNRVELIERADILMIDNSSLLPFDVICDILKKSKHIYMAEYLNLTEEQCSKMLSLSRESGSVVQVSNPFFYMPAVLWLNENVKSPVYLDVSKFVSGEELKNTLFQLLLMFDCVAVDRHKRVGAIGFNSIQKETGFYNVRLEFVDASVLNLTLGDHFDDDIFKVEGFTKSDFFLFDINDNSSKVNRKARSLSEYSPVREFDEMIESIQNASSEKGNLEEYRNAIQLVEKVEKKITQINS